MGAYIALLRGINVGRAKRIAMADLRDLLVGLGYADVRTLLNSGNVVFNAARADRRTITAQIEDGIKRRFGFSVKVVVLEAAELDEIVQGAPLLAVASDPSRHMVGFPSDASVLTRAASLLEQPWSPDALAVGGKAVYLWCVEGVIKSRLMQAFTRSAGDDVTVRNWATVLKLRAMVGAA